MNWQAWIFDLDDTLLDTSGQLIPQVSQRVCDFLFQQKIFTNLDEGLKIWDEKKNQYAGKVLIEKLIAEKMSPGAQREKLILEAYQIFRTPKLVLTLSLLPGGREILESLSTQIPLFLVTQGDIPTQIKKVEILQISNYFRQIYYVDPFMGENKTQAFNALLSNFSLDPHFVLSIGNRLDNEIERSKKLEIKTCYFPYGEHRLETPQTKEQEPDFQIKHLAELQALLFKQSQGSESEELG